MEILITGNTSALSKRLFSFLSLDNKVFLTGRDGNADVYLDLSKTNETPTDLPKSLDAIIHCAASFKGNSINDALENELINSLGSFKIMEIAEKTSCKQIVYISTISTYNFDENEYFGSYGLSKKHGQENLKYFCKTNDIVFTALMIPQVYDEYFQFVKHQGMFYRIVESAYLGQDINIYGNKDPLRNFLHVIDLIAVIGELIECKIQGEYNCVSSRSYKISEIAELALSIFKKGGQIRRLKEMPDIGNIYIPNDNDLFNLLKYKPKIDLKLGIEMLRNEYELRGK